MKAGRQAPRRRMPRSTSERNLAIKITESLARRKPFFSFEFFPPKTDDGVTSLFATIAALRALEPSFVSITYGAGGSTRARTVELAKRIRNDLGLDVLAHVTCVGASRDELRELFDDLAAANIENIMALRGDPPKGETAFVPAADGFAHASEMIAMLRREYDFCIGGACYPETHPDAPDAGTDLRNLIEKVRSGADFLTTQLFFDNEAYFAFVERARAAGIDQPIVPGIMPITDYQTDRAVYRDVRRDDPRRPARRTRAASRRTRSGGGSGRRLRDPAMRRLAGARRSRDPLLYAQPFAGHSSGVFGVARSESLAGANRRLIARP